MTRGHQRNLGILRAFPQRTQFLCERRERGLVRRFQSFRSLRVGRPGFRQLGVEVRGGGGHGVGVRARQVQVHARLLKRRLELGNLLRRI